MPGVLSTFNKISFVGSHLLQRKVVNGGLAQQIWLIEGIKRVFSTSTDDSQYLKKRSVPTSHFQDSLPHLPIPKLEDTCARYLRAQKPLLDDFSYKETEQFVVDFMKNEGPICQNILLQEDKENKHTSYISKPWSDMYLRDRKPLPINFNPLLVFVKNDDELYNNQPIRATNLVMSSLRFYKSLEAEYLEPEIYHVNPQRSDTALFRKFTGLLPRSVSWYGAYLFKAYPLDMSQYPSLFNTTRVPEVIKDSVKHGKGRGHILIMRRGHFYVFDVLDNKGDIVPIDDIYSAIKHILSLSEPQPKHPIGVLTTENRNVWAAARKYLENLGNSDVLDLIDTSLFNLVLDDENPGTDHTKLIRLFLHGDGTNRWFDKSFSLIISQNGDAGVNFEHSWGDGVAVLRYFNEVHEDSTKNAKAIFQTVDVQNRVHKLDFIMDDKIKTCISGAKKRYGQVCSSLQVRVLDYKKFGRQLCKPLNISPDAMMQLAFQMAYYKLKGKQVPTYESCSTAAFKHGRTETVRPCTMETKEMCIALRQSPLPPREELQRLIINCSTTHSQLIKEAAMGLGFDRHLFALRLKCEERGLTPAIFSDPAFQRINQNVMSTSTLNSECLLMGAFGPVVPNGFGIGYSIWKDRLGTIVTNYTGRADGEGFIKALEQSFDQIYSILKP